MNSLIPLLIFFHLSCHQQNWDMLFKATQLDLHWFIATAFYNKNVHISLLASLGKLSSSLQVMWSLSSSSSMISFSPSISQPTGSSSGCVFRPFLHTFFFTWAQLAMLLLPAFPFLTFAQLLSDVSLLASVTVQPLMSSCNSKNWQKKCNCLSQSLLLFAHLV